MSISLNPLDVLKWFRDNGVRDHQLIVQYVQEIADTAAELATLWCDTIADLAEPPFTAKRQPFGRQTFLCTKLEKFYDNATPTIRGRMKPELRNRLSSILGSFIDQRNQTTAMHCRAMREFLSPDSRLDRSEIIEQARRLANTLQANAAALQVLATELRSMS